jgi:ABC-type nitrate/sulfonate/bicarbonate transport system permease component
MSRIFLPIALLAALLGLWELLAQAGVLADVLDIRASVSDLIVPAPSDVASALWEDRDLLADNGWVTLQEVLLGFGIAVALGAAFALILHLSETGRRAFYPLLVASQTIPIVAIAPVLALWLGYGIGPKLAVIALVCFFPVTVSTLDGLRSVDPAAVRMMRTLHAGRMTVLRRLEIPAALPRFFSGVKIAAAVSVIGAVFGELVGANDGLGLVITQAQAQLLTARVFAAVVVLSAFAIVLFGAVVLLERIVAPWGRKETA